jgi:hypothetical protein
MKTTLQSDRKPDPWQLSQFISPQEPQREHVSSCEVLISWSSIWQSKQFVNWNGIIQNL